MIEQQSSYCPREIQRHTASRPADTESLTAGQTVRNLPTCRLPKCRKEHTMKKGQPTTRITNRRIKAIHQTN